MAPSESLSSARNRAMLESLLSTRTTPHPHATAMLDLADHLERTGFVMSGWQLDGPSVRVRFHGASGDLRATLAELGIAAQAFHAGRTEDWKELLLQEPGGVDAIHDASSGFLP